MVVDMAGNLFVFRGVLGRVEFLGQPQTLGQPFPVNKRL